MLQQPPSPLRDEDYEAIEAAVMETARGRWFLFEYARRNRSADTQQVLAAVERIERMIRRNGTGAMTDSARSDLADIRDAIERARRTLAELREEAQRNGRELKVEEDFDVVVAGTEQSTREILAAAERIQEIAWVLREQGIDDQSCDELDQRATSIYLACTFQHMTAQRMTRLVDTLRFIETRIAGIMDGVGEAPSRAAEPSVPAEPARLPSPEPPVIDVAAEAPTPPPAEAAPEPEPASALDEAASDEDLFELDAPETEPSVRRPPMVEPIEIDFVDAEVGSGRGRRRGGRHALLAPPRQNGAAALALEPEPEDVAPLVVEPELRVAPASRATPRPVAEVEPELRPTPSLTPMVATIDFAELAFAEKAALFS